MPSLDAAISQVADLVRQARNCIALTGAGISTPSGIPDFRSPNTGLWEKADPMTVASITGFWSDPTRFYEWMRPVAHVIHQAQPNLAHFALVELEQMHFLQAIITQNIDLLHHKAGSNIVHEVHGQLRELTCTRCYRTVLAENLLTIFLETGAIPFCSCGGVYKPNVILFGEQLPARVVLAAKKALREADLVLVIGSSLEVFPVADFPRQAKHQGAKVALINLGPTYFDTEADLVIHADVVETLPAIVAALKQTV